MIVPDSVEVIEGWRFWQFDSTGLKALNGAPWEAGKEHVAYCNQHQYSFPLGYYPSTYYQWSIVANGLTRAAASEFAQTHSSDYYHIPTPPDIELPKGVGYHAEPLPDSRFHESPEETCSCGIYAGTDLTVCPGGAPIYGKVKMWGKVIPGEKGWRSNLACGLLNIVMASRAWTLL